MNTKLIIIIGCGLLGGMLNAYQTTFTFTDYQGTSALSYKYYDTVTMLSDGGPGDPPREITTVALSQFDLASQQVSRPNDEIAAIIVTIRSTMSGAQVAVDSDGASSGSGQLQAIINYSVYDFNYAGSNDLFGVNTFDENSFIDGSGSLSITADNGNDDFGSVEVDTPGNDYASWTQSTPAVDEKVTTVNPNFEFQFIGNSDVTFNLIANLGTNNTFTGDDLYFSGNNPSGTFFAEIEYIVIPESSTLTLAGILFATSAGAFLLRRRRG